MEASVADIVLKIVIAGASALVATIARSWHADRKAHQKKLEEMVAATTKKVDGLAESEARRTEAARAAAHTTTLVQKSLDRIAVLERDKETIFRRIDANSIATENLRADLSELRVMLSELNNEIGPRMAHGQ